MLKQAQEARKANILNKLIRVDGVVVTQGQWITDVIADGGRVEVREVPAVTFNRVKYNRMYANEQAAYERTLEKKRLEYRLYKKDNSYFIINKTLYDFALIHD